MKKLTMRIIFICVSAILLLSIVPVTTASAAPDETPPAVQPIRVPVPTVQKNIEGDNPATSETFSFMIQAERPTSPMPSHSTITINGQGTGNFGDIVFSEPGVFYYGIYEVPGSSQGYTYDTTIYILEFTISPNGAALAPSLAIYTQTGAPVNHNPIFTNTYKTPDQPVAATPTPVPTPQASLTPTPVPTGTTRPTPIPTGTISSQRPTSTLPPTGTFPSTVPTLPGPSITASMITPSPAPSMMPSDQIPTFMPPSFQPNPASPSPQTSDNSNIPLYITLFVVSCIGAAAAFIIPARKRGKESK